MSEVGLHSDIDGRAGTREGPEKEGPFLFTRPALAVMGGLLVVGAYFGRPALTLLTAAFLAAALTARVWSRLSLVRLEYRRKLSTRRAFPGDTVEMTLVMENRKPLPLAWIEAADHAPGLAPEEQNGDFLFVTSLLWYRRHSRRLEIFCRRRGIYEIGPARLTSGDVFGFIPRKMEAGGLDRLIVYPKLYPLDRVTLPSNFPMGEAPSISRIHDDPTRVRGVRPYTRDVPFRHIHWKATARRPDIQVKSFEPTVTLDVSVVLDVEGFEEGDDFELAVSLAASIVRYVIDLGQPAGCWANSGLGGAVRAPAGAGGRNLTAVLEALAGVSARPGVPIEDLFSGMLAACGKGATVCYVTRRLTGDRLARLEALQQRGYPVFAWQIGPEPAPAGPVPCAAVGGPGDLSREGADE